MVFEMEEDEKMGALRKAYADMILHTAKEAAARILLSERKALRYQQQLFAAKEDALNTLLRLKQVMDFKIAKADKLTLELTRKVQELEAQLNEAEDTVIDLRDELKRVHDELHKMKNNWVDLMRVQPVKSPQGSCGSFDAVPQKKIIDENCHFISEIPSVQSEKEVNNSDVGSVIMGSKEQEPFRNGCTQRIRALEQNLLAGMKTPVPGDIHGACRCEMNESTTKEDKAAGQRQTGTLDVAEMTVDLPESLIGLREYKSDEDQVVKFFRRSPSRQKRGRCTYTKETRIEVKPSEPNTKSAQGDTDYLFSLESTKTPEDLNRHDPGSARDKNSEYVKEDHKVEDTSVAPATNETVEVLVESLDPEKVNTFAANRLPQSLKHGHLKYTFCRKRKRQPLGIHKDETIVKKSISNRRDRDKQSAPVSEKPSLETELSRDSRRLVQVARQLISLSEKQWW